MTDAPERLRISWGQGDTARAVMASTPDSRDYKDLYSPVEYVRIDRITALEAEVARLVKRFTPRRLRYAPKDRLIIGVERPPYEDDTFFYDLIWSEDRGQFVTPFVNALNGATHFLDPRDMIGLPPQERLSRAERKQANNAARALAWGEQP